MSNTSTLLALALLAVGLAACKPTAQPAAAAPGNDAAPAALVGDPATPAATPAQAANDAPDDFLRDVFARFKALRSYEARMHIEGSARGPIDNLMRFVAPDRYSMTMRTAGMEVTQVHIGKDVYVSVGGRTIKTTLPQQADPSRWYEDFDAATLSAQAQGSETVDGVETRKYRLDQAQSTPRDVTVWIDGQDRVRQARIEMPLEGRPTTTTIVYSRFDDPSIRIEPLH